MSSTTLAQLKNKLARLQVKLSRYAGRVTRSVRARVAWLIIECDRLAYQIQQIGAKKMEETMTIYFQLGFGDGVCYADLPVSFIEEYMVDPNEKSRLDYHWKDFLGNKNSDHKQKRENYNIETLKSERHGILRCPNKIKGIQGSGQELDFSLDSFFPYFDGEKPSKVNKIDILEEIAHR